MTEGTLVLAVPLGAIVKAPHIGKVIEVTRMHDCVSTPGKKIPVYVYKVTFYHPHECCRVTNKLRIDKLMEAPTLPRPPTTAGAPKTRKGMRDEEAILLKEGTYVLAKTGRGNNTIYLPAVFQSFTQTDRKSKHSIAITVRFCQSGQVSTIKSRDMIALYNDSHSTYRATQFYLQILPRSPLCFFLSSWNDMRDNWLAVAKCGSDLWVSEQGSA